MSEMKKFILQQDECAIPSQLILSHLRRSPDIIEPTRGYPNIQQVSNCAKYLRRLQGTKNSREAVRRLAKENAYNPTSDMSQAFIFGHHDDKDGFPYVGKGADADAFCIGVTSKALLSACIEFCSAGRFTLFHADATFKLSDLGYSIITCGFSYASRTYQLGAIFVVIRRTAQEYAMGMTVFTRVVKRFRPTATLHIDVVMGDAEEAQMNGLQQVSEFSTATYLMCFFHVLYNVRKRTRHLIPANRRSVMGGIVRMHYAENMSAYYTLKDEVLKEWKKTPELKSFVSYFSKQWLDSRFWRWQIFHTPSGYAVTNNPCETFNAVLKKYTGRRRYHMQRLISISKVVVEDITIHSPTPDHQIVAPNRVTSLAASALISTDRVEVLTTDNEGLCRVKQLRKSDTTEAEDLEELCEAIDTPFKASTDKVEEDEEETEILGTALLVREQRARAAQLYKNVVSWSLRYAHTVGMPENGWIVDVEKCICGCKYYLKVKTCCHVVVARKAKKLGRPGGSDLNEKLFNRTIGKKKLMSITKKQKKDEQATQQPLPLAAPLEGRPPLASKALDVQFIMCPDT